MSHTCVVGVDLGGTNVRACCYLEDGTEASQPFTSPSNAQDGTDAVLDSIASVVRQSIDASSDKPVAVGMAVPGHIDSERGIVVWAPNFGQEVGGVFRYWQNVSLAKQIADMVKLPVVMGNDANLAALGEYRYGSGRNSASALVMLTLGTGIGGGVVLGPGSVLGKAQGPLVLVGGNAGGAELGHATVLHGGLDCNAGSYGALEAYCQRDAIVQRAIHRIRRGRTSCMLDLAAGDIAAVTPLTISKAAEQGDECAIEVLAETGTYLGVAIGSFINIFAPAIVAIGGNIARSGEFILEPARKSARNVAIPSLFKDCEIKVAERIDDAGLLGAAALAAERLKE